MYFQDGGRHRLEFYWKLNFALHQPSRGQCLSAYTKFDANIFIDDRDMSKKQNQRWRPPPSWISNECPISPHMANMKLHAKFGANWPRRGWDTLACVFSRWRPSAILVCYSLILDHPQSPHDGLYLQWQWRNDPIWCNRDVAILRFWWFGWKMAICALLGHFWPR